MKNKYVVRQRVIEYYLVEAESEHQAMNMIDSGVVDPFEFEHIDYTIEIEKD